MIFVDYSSRHGQHNSPMLRRVPQLPLRYVAVDERSGQTPASGRRVALDPSKDRGPSSAGEFVPTNG